MAFVYSRLGDGASGGGRAFVPSGTLESQSSCRSHAACRISKGGWRGGRADHLNTRGSAPFVWALGLLGVPSSRHHHHISPSRRSRVCDSIRCCISFCWAPSCSPGPSSWRIIPDHEAQTDTGLVPLHALLDVLGADEPDCIPRCICSRSRMRCKYPPSHASSLQEISPLTEEHTAKMHPVKYTRVSMQNLH